jgi:hypothetical protein
MGGSKRQRHAGEPKRPDEFWSKRRMDVVTAEGLVKIYRTRAGAALSMDESLAVGWQVKV